MCVYILKDLFIIIIIIIILEDYFKGPIHSVSMQTEWIIIHYNLAVRGTFSSLSMQAILLSSFNLVMFTIYLWYKKNKQGKQIRNHIILRIANKMHFTEKS